LASNSPLEFLAGFLKAKTLSGSGKSLPTIIIRGYNKILVKKPHYIDLALQERNIRKIKNIS
jgi:hypothetical protein